VPRLNDPDAVRVEYATQTRFLSRSSIYAGSAVTDARDVIVEQVVAVEPETTLPDPGGLTVDQVAAHLAVSPSVIYDWISHNKLAADRDRSNRLRIPFDSGIEQECRQRIANSAHIPQTKIAATGGAV